MQNESGKFVSPKDSLPNVRKILNNVDLSGEQIQKICYAIEHHEEYNWSGANVSDLNTLILQDADNLDAIGAIGIGRTFSYMAVHGMPMYDENIPLDNMGEYAENDVVASASTIHHIYHKLLKLGDNMNTETARRIARKRIRCMKSFAEEFLKEWNAGDDF